MPSAGEATPREASAAPCLAAVAAKAAFVAQYRAAFASPYKAAELGFGAIYVSEESGGIGLGRLESALIFEAMSYGCPSTSATLLIPKESSMGVKR